MTAKRTSKPSTNLEFTEQQTECFVCKKSVFKVARITPELVMMKCVNCGETHMIAVQSTEKAVKPLTFWDADQVTCI